ncbi:hypothetical protein JCM5353_000590 [Sporobolomyces roseus]
MAIEHTQHSELFNKDRYGHYTGVGLTATLSWSSPLPAGCAIAYSPGADAFQLYWTPSSKGVYIEGGEIIIRLTTVETRLELRAGVFPPTPSGFLPFPAIHIALHSPCDITARFNLGSTGKDYAPAFAASLRSRVSSNVCFDFPRIGRQLWANETVLRKASPYFENLFSSGFAEDSASSTKVSSESSSDLPPYTFEDSDDEMDPVFQKTNSPESATPSSLPPFKTITITDATYSTYYSVLCWIGTGHIVFAPLHSTSSASDSAGEKEVVKESKSKKKARRREATLNALEQVNGPLPPPSSPKSVYRLAHFLELPELVNLALQNFKSQLKADNATYELFSDVASSYPEIRDVALGYVVENWKNVIKSKSYEVIRSKADKGEGDVGIAMLLGERLMKRWSK